MGGLDLDSRSSGCARLGGGVGPPLGVVVEEVAVEGLLITTPEATNTASGFNRGSRGGARGCGFEERVGAYAHTEGGHFLYSI